MSKNEDALRQVLRFAVLLEDAAKPMKFDGDAERMVCKARKAAAEQLYEVIGRELDMSEAQLKEFAFSRGTFDLKGGA